MPGPPQKPIDPVPTEHVTVHEEKELEQQYHTTQDLQSIEEHGEKSSGSYVVRGWRIHWRKVCRVTTRRAWRVIRRCRTVNGVKSCTT